MTLEEFYDGYQVRRLRADEKIPSFDCGDEDLNDFIINDASAYRKALLAVTYIVEEKVSGTIVAYFSLANDRVGLADFPDKTQFNRFRKHKFVNEKRLKSYPATKICRLGIAEILKGQHIGSYLMDFIKTMFVMEDRTGCRFLTVDAYSDAVKFYQKNDFEFLSVTDEGSRTRLLYYDLADLNS
ncbi:MAG: GNAT family N-acetyltransferase [Bacteroides sp.]|nr:GNAT family N-acetyltransferase [Bacteroides sp.]